MANFMMAVDGLSNISILLGDKESEELILKQNLRHEAIAYLNRVGQFFPFCQFRICKTKRF